MHAAVTPIPPRLPRESSARSGSITTFVCSRPRRDKKLTGDGREEFGFFSVLRAREHVRIMLARFDLTVLIGT